MSTEAKMELISELEEAMQDDLTVSVMRKLKEALGDMLTRYLVEIQRPEEQKNGDDLMDTFLNAKRVEGLAEKTIKRYQRELAKLVQFTGLPMGKIKVGDIRNYLTAEKDRGLADRSLHGARDIFSSCFGWLHREGLISRNPCGNIKGIKYADKIRVPFSETDIELMKEACDCIRDRTIIAFLLSTGARISEVCALNRDDIDFHEMECVVMGKGSKERTVYIDDVAGMMLKRYLKSRTDGGQALFVGRLSERLTDNGIRKILKRVEAASGVENIHPHRFRRTLATSLINRGMSIQEVARILGHSKIDTTMQYIYIEQENVKNNYRRYA